MDGREGGEVSVRMRGHVAIVGAGFAGVAAAWHLLNSKRFQVTLFDKKGIGGGASGVSTGLMHPYVGRHARRSWMATEGVQCTQELLEIAQQYSRVPIIKQTGIYRPAGDTDQELDFRKCAEGYSDVEWWDGERAAKSIPGLNKLAGIFLTGGLAIDSMSYLRGLWKGCEALGGVLERAEIANIEELSDFSHVVLATGAEPLPFAIERGVKLRPVKGQVLDVKWPNGMPPLPYSVNGQAYVVMGSDETSCTIGATFERQPQSGEPDPTVAEPYLLERAIQMIPGLKGCDVLECRAGIRAAAPDHKPFLKQLDYRCWTVGGLGSKGLLYHAWLGRQVVDLLGK